MKDNKCSATRLRGDRVEMVPTMMATKKASLDDTQLGSMCLQLIPEKGDHRNELLDECVELR